MLYHKQEAPGERSGRLAIKVGKQRRADGGSVQDPVLHVIVLNAGVIIDGVSLQSACSLQPSPGLGAVACPLKVQPCTARGLDRTPDKPTTLKCRKKNRNITAKPVDGKFAQRDHRMCFFLTRLPP